MLDVAKYMIDRHRYKALDLTTEPNASLICAYESISLPLRFGRRTANILRNKLLGSHHDIALYNPTDKGGKPSSF
jgi:hypothetical protein